jgi:hypothetical protein
MKWQALRGSVVGLFASLGLIGWAGPGVAPSEVVQLEPSFELKTDAGEAVTTIAPWLEPSFELKGEAGEAVAVVGPGSEPTFELGTAAGEAVAKVAPQSEPEFGVRTAQLLEKR